jgi:NAD(P)-dependent dehydrogenase (short-subunit alcohol dehydrogenase family)
MNAMVRALAIELAPDRVRVNAICPGTMHTSIVESLGRPIEEMDISLPDRSHKARVIREDRDTTAEVANVHLFLCSSLADYVNGEVISVDGGFSIWNGT